MKISKRTREQAWLICALLASYKATPDDGLAGPMIVVGDAIEPKTEAVRLAWLAAAHVRRSISSTPGQSFSEMPCHECGAAITCGSLDYAEAAALLAEGWEP